MFSCLFLPTIKSSEDGRLGGAASLMPGEVLQQAEKFSIVLRLPKSVM